MAQGGRQQCQESLRNNLCENDEEKMINEKSVMENMALPELCQHHSVLYSYPCHLWNQDTTEVAVNKHSQCSTTELKQYFLNCPQLTPASSHESLSHSGQACTGLDFGPGLSRATSSSVQLPSIFNSHDHQSLLESSVEPDCQSTSVPEEKSILSVNSNIVSSYLRADASSTADSYKLDTASPCGKKDVTTNDLNNEERHGIHGGVGTVPVANPILPASTMYVPVNLTLSGFPSQGFMTYPIFNSNGMPAFVPMMPASAYASAAVSGQCVQNVASVPPNFKQNFSFGPGPLTANFGGGGCMQTQEQRPNIPLAPMSASSTPSSEDNNNCSRSFSLQPNEDTRLVRLRKPVLDWLAKKLDMPCRDNWEALADKRGMNYEDICAHLNTCRHNQQSPFFKLLETEQFCAYTVKEFLIDLQNIRRRDIIDEFGSVLERNT